MKKFVFLFIFSVQLLCLKAQKVCWIAISTNDCSVCQSSYFFIKRIDSTLNPILVLNEADSLSAEFFVREHLGLKTIPYIVNNKKFETLVKDQFSLQVKLYDGKTLLKEMPVKYLAERYLELNALANKLKFRIEDTSFNEHKLDSLNHYIKKYFIGHTESFNFKEEMVLYNKLSNYAVCANLKTNKCMAIKLVDSNIYHSIFGHEQDSKRFYYQSILEDNNEVEIYSYAYNQDKLYLSFAVVNYTKMGNAKELELANMEVEFAWDTYLAEYSISGGSIKLLRKMNIKNQHEDIEDRVGFSLFNDNHVLFLKEKTKSNDLFYFINLSDKWDISSYLVKRPELMSKYLVENEFYNHVIYNDDEFILINNNTGKYRKLFEGKMMESMLLTGGDLYVYNNWVYFNVLHRKSKSHKLIRVSLETSKVEVLQEFTEQEAYSFYPVFYHDEVTQTLYVLDISDKKAMYIVGSVKL